VLMIEHIALAQLSGNRGLFPSPAMEQSHLLYVQCIQSTLQ
jgi:hypothetical protein